MRILRTRRELGEFLAEQRAAGRTIGLVPTMGALHAGHMSLVRRAVAECGAAVASVFVNPTQFNNPTDLATYPRDEEADFCLLREAGVAAVFAPTVEEMYPGGQERDHEFDLGEVAEVMEGRFRPGHFQGVAQVVSLLFRLVRPDHAYFGQKDYQQIAVLRRMVATEGIDVDIVACPIVREPDGLALSSRNMLLTPEQRSVAPGIHRIMEESLDYARSHSLRATHDTVTEAVDALPGCRVEYFEIADADTLRPLSEWPSDGRGAIGCITVYCGSVRLIDNILYASKQPC